MRNRSTFLAVVMVLSTACNDNAGAGSAADHPDSMSVKKMGTDSNSDMPVHLPGDSSAPMPNALDTSVH